MDALNWFKQIAKIPRPSGHEEQIRDFIINFAKEQHYDYKTDEVGNICINVPGKGTGVGKPILVFQSHMDMVCEKLPNVEHDFLKDPIRIYEENGFLKAHGTTLGADNGIGIALSFAVLDLPNHPPLELVFTVDEEETMKGASHMQPGFFKGKYFINIDSEEDTTFTTGCAGSLLAKFKIPITRDAGYSAACKAVFVVDKLMGGHSGSDIHKGRRSATKICVDQLLAWTKENINFRLIDIETGSAMNAIARFGKMYVAFASVDDFNKAQHDLVDVSEGVPEEKPELTFTKTDIDLAPLTQASHNCFINVAKELPHGPIAFYDSAKTVVETSCNFASIKRVDNNYVMTLFYRSSEDYRFPEFMQKINQIATAYSVSEEHDPKPDPAWPPRKNNPLLDLCKECYKDLFHKEALSGPIHAGLECSYMEKLCPDLMAISMGPNLFDPHSPTERLELASLDRVQRLLFAIVEKFIEKF